MKALLFTLAVSAVACAPPLADTQASADALAREVLVAIARRDEPRLAALALDEREFEEYIWPSLPAARPERNLPWSYVWGDLRQKSGQALQRTLAEHGDRRYELVSVRFAEGVTEYAEYRVHRAPLLAVRDAAGQALEIRLCGSFVEKDGGWKVFSYVVDD